MNPIGFVSEMVYPTYTKADTYSLAVLRRARINSFGSPLVLFIPGPNIIFLNSSMNLQQVSISKFEKLWLMVPKLSNRGWSRSFRTHETAHLLRRALRWWLMSRIAATTRDASISDDRRHSKRFAVCSRFKRSWSSSMPESDSIHAVWSTRWPPQSGQLVELDSSDCYCF